MRQGQSVWQRRRTGTWKARRKRRGLWMRRRVRVMDRVIMAAMQMYV